MDYIDAATTEILSPHVLPIQDIRKILKYIEETLTFTLYLPISSDDTLHLYRYLCTHILIADEQFHLLINVLIQDHTQEIEVYKVFNLDIPHGNYSLCYDIENKHLGDTQWNQCHWNIRAPVSNMSEGKQTIFFYIKTHHFYHLPTHQHVYQVNMPRTRIVYIKDVPYRSGRPTALAYQHP